MLISLFVWPVLLHFFVCIYSSAGWTSIDGDIFVDNDTEGSRDSTLAFPRDEMDKLKAEATATLIATRYIGEKKDDKVVNF